jgi:hypothetical protein
MKSWQEEPEKYKIFKMIVAQQEQNAGDVINKMIRRYIAENQEKE